jgi:hypothetical protein
VAVGAAFFGEAAADFAGEPAILLAVLLCGPTARQPRRRKPAAIIDWPAAAPGAKSANRTARLAA